VTDEPAAGVWAPSPSAAAHSPWLSRRRRVALSAAFLVYTLFVALNVASVSHGAAEAAGYVVLGAFCAVYLVIADRGSALGDRGFWVGWATLAALTAVQTLSAQAVALMLCLYLTALVVARRGWRAWPVVLLLAVVSLVVPLLVASWHVDFVQSIELVTPVAIPVVALASVGLQQITAANFELAQARSQVARLSAENERTRIARDLHDLLGHSLTTITVKAGLAHRLGAVDPPRALAEIAEVEALARRSLTDVRAAVSGYREVTLAGELATGRELLRAAGIDADLPTAVDAVALDHHELFGWVVREGLTNVVRHSHARSCAVRVTRASVEIVDDGEGVAAPASSPGNGLSGLRERVAAAGGRLETGPRAPRGWELRVSLS
jgi:two-component system, NarL family, sensor histidine kinase DesK